MAIVTTDNAHYQNIASKIREKKGTNETIFPSEMPQKVDEVYTAGYEKGKAEGGDNPLYYAKQPATLFMGADFPADEELTIRFRNTPNSFDQLFFNAACPKRIRIVVENIIKNISMDRVFMITSAATNLVSIELTGIGAISSAFATFDGQNLLEEVIGDLDLSACTETTNTFRRCNALREVRFKENTIPASIGFTYCPLLSDNSIQSIIDGLITITDGVARTITFHATVKGKLTDEQKATITTTKGWTLS